jgi:nitric oxide reductase NorE protein
VTTSQVLDPGAYDDTAPPPAKHLPGEVGLWVFILGDMGFFALFFGIIVVTHGQQTEMFRESQHLLHPGLAVINTLVLLTGSFLVAKALRALRRRGSRPHLLVIGTLGCAGVFATIKIVEYVLLTREGHTPTSNDFFMYYFVFTGIHLLHLLIGVGMLIAVLVVAIGAKSKEMTPGRLKLAESGASFWHMVDLLWLVLFPLLYVVR